MYFCYLDESGTPADPQTKEFVLVGVAVPATQWKVMDSQIMACKRPYGIENVEIHTGWMLRKYNEQDQIPNFVTLTKEDRVSAVNQYRKAKLLHCAAVSPDKLKNLQKTYKKTDPYIHLTLDERRAVVKAVLTVFGQNSAARLFGHVVNISHYMRMHRCVPQMFEHSFERVVNRFQAFLENRESWAVNHGITSAADAHIGLLIQDNNETVSLKLTQLMRKFHLSGTRMRTIRHIVETPLFVDSELTCMVQVADICAYAIRRFLENGETTLFDILYPRVDRAGSAVVGLRHFADSNCSCRICADYRSSRPTTP